MSKKFIKTLLEDIDSLQGFIEAVERHSNSSLELKCYRGQRNSTWPAIARIFRPNHKALYENEKAAIRDLISVHPSEFDNDATMFDKLVRMQHYSLPTRLLDVSVNALVALYFACDPGPVGEDTDGVVIAFKIPYQREKYFDSDCVSCLSNLANLTKNEKAKIEALRQSRDKNTSKIDYKTIFNGQEVVQRLHQFIRAEKSYFLPIIEPIDLFKPYYVHPKMSNRRILSQSGAFIIYGLNSPNNIRYAHPIEESRFIIQKNRKGPIRDQLEKIGINDSTLFPELDRAAIRITNKY